MKRFFYLKIECDEDQVETIKILCDDLNTVLPEGNVIVTKVEYHSLEDLYQSELEKPQAVRDLYNAVKDAIEAQDRNRYSKPSYNGRITNLKGVDDNPVEISHNQQDRSFDFNFRGQKFRVSETELVNPSNINLGNFLRHLTQSTNKKKG